MMKTNSSVNVDERDTCKEVSANSEPPKITVNSNNSIDVISNEDDFFALHEQWNKINDESPKGNVFNSWEWLYTWWQIYQNQSKRSLYILTCTNKDNELLGIAPFQIINNPKKYFPCNRQLILLGTGETDGSLVFGEYMDLLIKPAHETSVIEAFSNYLEQHKDLWDGLKFQQQLAESHLSQLFQTGSSSNSQFLKDELNLRIVENGYRTVLTLPKTYKKYLMRLSKKMRNNITRIHSRLESEQNFTIDLITPESEVNAGLNQQDDGITVLSKLNRMRRRNDTAIASVFDQENFELFHRRLLKRLLPLNKVSLRILRFNEEPVAALYSFLDRDTVHVYQSGFETENGHRYSLLTTMLTQEISKSIENPDMNLFNFMYAEDEYMYKNRYSGATERMYDLSYDKRGLKYSLYRFIHGYLKSLVKKLLKMS